MRACSHALRPLVVVAVDVAVAAAATGEMAAAKAAAVDSVAIVMAARVAVAVVETAMAAKVVAEASAVAVMARVADVVAAPEPVVAMARAADVATEPVRWALTKPEEVEEMADPNRRDSRASHVRKLTQWIGKTELEEAAAVTVRTATAEADGEVTKSNPPTTPKSKLMPQKRRKRRSPHQSQPQSKRSQKRKLAPLLMSTERNKLPLPRDSHGQPDQDERRNVLDLRRAASLQEQVIGI